MINPKVETAFNEQIKYEIESAMLYYHMAGWFAAQGFDGMASWMLVQKGEELSHAEKFFAHIAARGGTPKVAVASPGDAVWKTPLEVFQAAYKHELFITGRINTLVDICRKENDNPGAEFLQWFVREQVEEEEQVSKIVQKLERIGASGSGLVMMDKETGKRKAS
jgi:ferritin